MSSEIPGLGSRREAREEALAILYQAQTKWKDATKMREKVVDLTDGSVESLIDLGLACFDARKHKDAVRAFEDVLRVDDENQTAWLNLGVLWHHHVRDHKKAAKAYRQYLNLGGKDDRVRGWLTEVEK